MYWVVGFIAVIALVLIYSYGTQYFTQAPGTEEEATRTHEEDATPTTGEAPFESGDDFPIDGAVTVVATSTTAEVRTIEIKGGMFYFDVKEIRAKKGEKIRIVFTNTEGFHNWVLDEFNARVPQISAGKTAEVTFTADKIGTFEYYCSVGSHRAQGMKGS